MNRADNPPVSHHSIKYELEHLDTRLGAGSFACLPTHDLDVEHGFEYIQEHPNDEFMHKHLLSLAGKFGPNLVREFIERGKGDNPCLLALMYEACLLNERLQDLTKEFDGIDLKHLAGYSPLIYIDWSLKEDRDKNAYWLRLFSENILSHCPRRPARDFELPLPFDQEALDAWQSKVVPITKLFTEEGKKISSRGAFGPTPAETAGRAMERLKAIGFRGGRETKNQASLSPRALKIPWHLQVRVSTGRNHWELTGPQTSYGKGLNMDQARASCWMEVVERVSAFASFDEGGALHYKHGHPLIHGRYEDLRGHSGRVLDPNEMLLEVPYENQPIYWISAERVDDKGAHPVYVPAQLVFLFSNLDEMNLTSGLPSTGLGAGNTLEGAKVQALLEVIERDAERVMPYVQQRCFSLICDQAPLKDLLQHCVKEGVHVLFLDITSEFGIPCYKAFIQGPNGEILKGCAAHLDGKRAAVSALTEVPYHPTWFSPVAAGHGVNQLDYQDLPNYSSGNVSHDLALLERLLITNGYSPIYVNLTRKDLDIPVVKALVPGLEMFSDFDLFSPLSLRQFAHYLKA
jgi:ribosomal protein S12 methylthiotransferase accessory factor